MENKINNITTAKSPTIKVIRVDAIVIKIWHGGNYG